jgi:hypothetical protein
MRARGGAECPGESPSSLRPSKAPCCCSMSALSHVTLTEAVLGAGAPGPGVEAVGSTAAGVRQALGTFGGSLIIMALEASGGLNRLYSCMRRGLSSPRRKPPLFGRRVKNVK